jgi:hypothetical protein
MYMFLPFLLALAGCVCLVLRRTGLGYALMIALIVVTVASFPLLKTTPLNVSF